ncbi:glycoside hydrolase family 3 protein [Morchella conica CCBAS932]|uniref:beta-glucosidase n=2 Tax=Morchella sect. Distantes TaxID=1051054 RepID=A0A3N4KC50_9PEZI|nr:glycoside hydrolase family 3 protein [Morchella conica CCBAS932]
MSSLATALPANSSVPANAIYKNPKASVDDRIADLISRMTLEEKVGQVMQGDISNWLNVTDGTFNRTGLVDSMSYKTGQFYIGYPVPWEWVARETLRGQKYLVEETRLGIPALVQTEGIHGFLIGNATIFNSPIAYGCAFDPDLVRQMAEVIAEEGAALGANHIFAPVVDLAREYRFGRVEEMFSEDPYLSGEYGHAYVVGLQSKKVAATVKHFAGFGTPEQGLNTAPVHGGEREMRRTYLPAFKRTIIDADAWSVMSAYHSYDGIPSAADYHLLTEVLRGEWGFKYHVMTDAGGSDKLCNDHGLCEKGDKRAVTMLALTAGNDVEMGGGSFNYRAIPGLLEDGTLDIEILDTAVSRILRTKFIMGLFENPYIAAPEDQWKKIIHSDNSVALARKIDRESIVLLENNGVLPLNKKKVKSIAVLGPMAHGFMNYGDYVVYKSQYRGVTPLDGINNALKGSNTKVTYAQGCERWSNDQSGFPEAIAAAKEAEVAVVVVGTWSRDQNELWAGLNATTGEHVDVHNLNLVGAQADLVREILAVNKNTVVVFSSGKPITEPWISNSSAALVQQFYPSEEGGNALADVLFGSYNPSGKLSVSIPRDVGTAPSYYDYLKGGRYVDAGAIYENGTMKFGHQYVLSSPLPLYPFGFGRSYTSFSFTNVTLSQTNVTADAIVTASLKVKNTGKVDGTEVVQLYVTDKVASVVVPNKELKGFAKIALKAGQEKTVKIDVDVSTLAVWNTRHQSVVEKGEFIVSVGDSSESLKSKASFWVG